MKHSESIAMSKIYSVIVTLVCLTGNLDTQALGSSMQANSPTSYSPSSSAPKSGSRSAAKGNGYEVFQAGLTRDPSLDARIQRGRQVEERNSESESKASKSKKKQRRSDSEKKEGAGPAITEATDHQDEPKVTVSGSVAMSVFLYETDKAFTPDFLADSAKIGLSGEDGPFKGELEASLADKGSGVGISKANVSGTSSFGSELKVGRAPLPEVNAYLANLNIYPFGLGIGDGLMLTQAFAFNEQLALSAGGGVVNALASDVSIGFDKRAASEFRGLFGFAGARLGLVALKGLYGSQKMLMTAIDDKATTGFSEEKGADFELFELSLGLEFERLSFGGFYSQKIVGTESYFVENQTPPAGLTVAGLSEGSDTTTFGGGVGYKHPVSVFYTDSESTSVNVGYSEQSKQTSLSNGTEQSIALTVGYSARSVSTSVNYGHYLGPSGFYVDSVTGRSFSSADRVSISCSYKFSK